MILADIALVIGAYLLGSLPYMLLLAEPKELIYLKQTTCTWHCGIR